MQYKLWSILFAILMLNILTSCFFINRLNVNRQNTDIQKNSSIQKSEIEEAITENVGDEVIETNEKSNCNEYTQEELTKLRISALSKFYPTKKNTTKENYISLFFDELGNNDPLFRELNLFLFDVKLGSQIADINYSSDAAFESIDKLNPAFLLSCCIENAKLFYWEGYSQNETTMYYLDGYECFTRYVEDTCGYFKEDVDAQANFFFGENVKMEHGEIESIYSYYDYAGVYTPPHVGGGLFSYPYVLSYKQNDNCYDVVFTSIVWAWGELDKFENPGLYGEKKQLMSVTEAVEWYREHGAQAKVVLEEQEDGRLIVKSLEILRGYDTLEDIEMQKVYGK